MSSVGCWTAVMEMTIMETKSVPVTRTVICQLETSNRKNSIVREKIEAWQEIAEWCAQRMPSYFPAQWQPQIPDRFNIVKDEFEVEGEHGINGLRSHDAYEALFKVAESYKSWKGNGMPSDDNPSGGFGDGDYLRVRDNGTSFEKNESGYGVKLSLEPYNPEWFTVKVGPYQREYIDRIVDDDDPLSAGSTEIHLHDDGSLYIHPTVSEDIEVPKVGEVERYVGVDINHIGCVAGVAVVEGGEVITGYIENGSAASGKEFKTKRDELSDKRDRAYANGNLRNVKKARGYRERYTEHVLHTASKNIVDFAREHKPCAIVLEDLTGYRESTDDPYHDWPFDSLQKKIGYKAKAEGIGVVDPIDAAGTSYTCNRCGNTNTDARSGPDFDCRRCDYHVHADVNAAINIGMLAAQK